MPFVTVPNPRPSSPLRSINHSRALHSAESAPGSSASFTGGAPTRLAGNYGVPASGLREFISLFRRRPDSRKHDDGVYEIVIEHFRKGNFSGYDPQPNWCFKFYYFSVRKLSFLNFCSRVTLATRIKSNGWKIRRFCSRACVAVLGEKPEWRDTEDIINYNCSRRITIAREIQILNDGWIVVQTLFLSLIRATLNGNRVRFSCISSQLKESDIKFHQIKSLYEVRQ